MRASCSASTRPAPSMTSRSGRYLHFVGSSADGRWPSMRVPLIAGRTETMRLSRATAIEIKTPSQIALMREAGLVVMRMLAAAAAAAVPGISTAELDAIADRELRQAGAKASFKGYFGYPATICTSVNDEIVHGIPRPDVTLS